MRTTVTLTADQAAKANELLLGPIDTYDTAWVNGTWVGSSGMSWLWRDYTVPAGVFKAGANVITPARPGRRRPDRPARQPPDQDQRRPGHPPSGRVEDQARHARHRPQPAAGAVGHPTSLTTLYNGMIAPVAPYTLKAAAWYQGRSQCRFPRPNMPVCWGRCSATGGRSSTTRPCPSSSSNWPPTARQRTRPGQSNWAELRESQRRAVDADPHAGLAVSIDFSDRSDIHPTQKTIIGNRLAKAAQAVVYGQDVPPGGPEVGSVTRQGNDIVVHFKYAASGLQTYSSYDAISFEVCTAPNVCQYAYGQVKGSDVILTGVNKPEIKTVRYAWADAPYVNLYSMDDLPAVPFTMDVQ
ncbi:MAG: hypothetical protein WDN06_13265 [Asticcacaulis sp.]